MIDYGVPVVRRHYDLLIPNRTREGRGGGSGVGCPYRGRWNFKDIYSRSYPISVCSVIECERVELSTCSDAAGMLLVCLRAW